MAKKSNKDSNDDNTFECLERAFDKREDRGSKMDKGEIELNIQQSLQAMGFLNPDRN